MLHRPRPDGEPPWPADRLPSDAGLRPCRASGGSGYDRIPRRPASGDHAGRRQGLRRGGLRDGAARDQRHATYRPEHQPAFRHRCAHNPPSRLCDQPAHPQTDRGRLRLDEDRRRAPKDEVSRPGQGRMDVYLCSRSLQSDPATEADDGAGLMARKQVPALALAFKGRWRIVAMDLWDKAAIDLVEPGFITFNGEEGEMRFIAVRAWLDVRYRSRDGVPIAEFSWEGIDEGDQRSGRGWATPADKGGLLGHIFFHDGDDSGFACERR